MSHFVYILKSETSDTFYIGETSDVEQRLIWHNNHFFNNAHTKIANDWELYFVLNCKDIEQARKIEKHIKAMKSNEKQNIHSKFKKLHRNFPKTFNPIFIRSLSR